MSSEGRTQEAEIYSGTLMRWNSSAEPNGGPPSLDEPLSSDRPDFTEASCTVGQGVTQLEMGYTFFHDRGPTSRVQSHSYPELLLRAGAFADWFELRVGWNFGSSSESFDTLTRSHSGSEDLYVGAKLGLTPQQGVWPEMALVPQMSVPLGGDFGTEEVLPGINWLYGWDLTEVLSTTSNTQINMAIDDETNDKFLEFAQSWAIGCDLTECVGVYTEWFVIVPAGAESIQTEHYFDAGLTYRLTNDLQLDMRIGKGVSSDAVDYFAGAGVVVRR
ncbi:MAG: transporter [Pirellulaceae bacterium]